MSDLAQAGSWREAARAAQLSLATQADPEIAALLGDCLLNMDGTGYIAAEPIYRAAIVGCLAACASPVGCPEQPSQLVPSMLGFAVSSSLL
jgi:hypothetical protein